MLFFLMQKRVFTHLCIQRFFSSLFFLREKKKEKKSQLVCLSLFTPLFANTLIRL